MEQNLNELKEIMLANPNLDRRIKSDAWSVSYNRRADMVLMGESFPKGSFYVPVEDGVLVRIGKNKKIYGFAIENAKSFIKRNPRGVGLALSFIVYPIRSMLFTLPVLFITYQAARMRSILSVSDFFAARTTYAV
ncbi:MAG: hypothetical protein NTU85_00925 [Candidatus Kaiserbacteria bacterium]|nr:hypothetical protein [Candidatus Kaiserbacteria bacterium]